MLASGGRFHSFDVKPTYGTVDIDKSIHALTCLRKNVIVRSMARTKTPLNIYIDAELMARLDKWLSAQTVPPSRTALVEAALRDFLDKKEPKGRSR